MNKKIIVYGLFIWAVPFIVAVSIYSLHSQERALFESIMAVTVAANTGLFSVLYLTKTNGNYYQKGIKIGVVWFLISIIIDLAMFMQGPMKIAFVEYIKDIGTTYLMIPILTTMFGYALSKKK